MSPYHIILTASIISPQMLISLQFLEKTILNIFWKIYKIAITFHPFQPPLSRPANGQLPLFPR